MIWLTICDAWFLCSNPFSGRIVYVHHHLKFGARCEWENGNVCRWKRKHKSFLVANQWQIVSFYLLLYSSALVCTIVEISTFNAETEYYSKLLVKKMSVAFCCYYIERFLFQHIQLLWTNCSASLYINIFHVVAVSFFLLSLLYFHLMSYPNSALRLKSHSWKYFDYKNGEVHGE